MLACDYTRLTNLIVRGIIGGIHSSLMTKELMQTLCDHAMGNYRALCTMANELLTTAAQQEKTQLDEKLYLECFAVKPPSRKQKNAVGGAGG